MAELGIILVADNGITVRFQQRNATTEATYDKVTVENMQEATRVLAAWMNVKFENNARECRRIHHNDQFGASIRDAIQGLVDEAVDG